jgi:hypothetical protein
MFFVYESVARPIHARQKDEEGTDCVQESFNTPINCVCLSVGWKEQCVQWKCYSKILKFPPGRWFHVSSTSTAFDCRFETVVPIGLEEKEIYISWSRLFSCDDDGQVG